MADLQNELKALVAEAARELSIVLNKGEKVNETALSKAFEAKDENPEPEASPVSEDEDNFPVGEEEAGNAPNPALDTPDDDKLVPGGEEPVEAEPTEEQMAGDETEGDFINEIAAAYSELDDEELCDHYMALKSIIYDRLKGAGNEAQGDGMEPGADAMPVDSGVEPMEENPLEMSEQTMSKSEKSKSMSKNDTSPAGSMQMSEDESGSSIEKDEGDAHESGGEMKKAKDPAGSGGKVSEQNPERKNKIHKDYPVKSGNGGSEKVAEGGAGRLEAVGKGDAPKKVRLDEVGGEDTNKSEGKVAELELKIDQLTKALELMINVPQRKSVTDRFELAKSENASNRSTASLSKAELEKKLKDLSKSEKLEKSERDLINNYYFGLAKASDLTDLINKHNK
jgi:hypothetical protein